MSYSSQLRRVEVSAVGSPLASADAPDYLLFNRTVQWTDPFEGHGGQASQRSELFGDRVSVSSSLYAADGRSGFNATAASIFDIAFSLDQPSPATMTGSWIMATQITGVTISGQIRLSHDGAPVWTIPINASDPTIGAVPFSFSGELTGGNYRLEASASLVAALIPGFTTGTGSLAATLIIPVPSTGLALVASFLGSGANRATRRTSPNANSRG